MTFGPESAPRAADDTRRWQRWVEDQLKLLRSSRGTLERGSVSGGIVTVREILTNPAAGIAFNNTDSITATGPGPLDLALSFEPLPGSLHLRWNASDQPPTEWTLTGSVVTFHETHVIAGDVITAAYAYNALDVVPLRITSPTNGDTIYDPTPLITGTAPNGHTVTVLIDGVAVGTAVSVSGIWSLESSTILSAGAHTAVATDGGLSSDPVSFTVVKSFATYMGSILPSWWDRFGEASALAGSVDASGNGHGGAGTTFASVTFGATGLVSADTDTACAWAAPGRLELPYGAWMNSPAISGAILYKTTNTDLNGICFVSRWDSSVATLWAFDHVNGAIRLRLNGATVTSPALGVNNGNKHLAGFTYDGATVNLISDGVVVKTQAVAGAVITGSAKMTIGADYGGGGGSLLHHFAGTLDEPSYKAGLWTPQNFKTMWELAS